MVAPSGASKHSTKALAPWVTPKFIFLPPEWELSHQDEAQWKGNEHKTLRLSDLLCGEINDLLEAPEKHLTMDSSQLLAMTRASRG